MADAAPPHHADSSLGSRVRVLAAIIWMQWERAILTPRQTVCTKPSTVLAKPKASLRRLRSRLDLAWPSCRVLRPFWGACPPPNGLSQTEAPTPNVTGKR